MSTVAMDQITDCGDLRSPVRNRYFYGKLMDTHHFELETAYFNRLRWMHNRLVTGWGVVCGLDVWSAPKHEHVVVGHGFAIDRCGREIVIPCDTRPLEIPPDVVEEAAEDACDDRDGWKKENVTIHVVLCYHECPTNPVPVMTTECNGAERCAPGAIEERYRVEFRPGPARRVPTECHEYEFPDVLSRGEIDYALLARWVTRSCPERPADCCIPLADIHISGDDRPGCGEEDVDITVRPIVYTNDLLFLMLLSLLEERSSRRTK